MPDYQNGKIYKIINDDLPNLIYYGSTTQKRLSRRMATHRCQAIKPNPTKSKILFESGTPKIILVELFPCNSKEELYKRERYYIENNECVNYKLPGRTQKEYYEDVKNTERYKNRISKNKKDNIELQKKWSKDWYENKGKEKRKEKYTCECGTTLTIVKKKRHETSNKHKKYLETI